MTITLPTHIYNAAQTRAIDAAIIAGGVEGGELMQRAAGALWEQLLRRWPDEDVLTVLCGGGNNGGDGYLVACLARMAGWDVRVLALCAPEKLHGDAQRAYRLAMAEGIEITAWQEGESLRGVVLDAMLGTGLDAEVREPYAGAIRAINASGLPTVSVDLPSGLHADSGVVLGEAVTADMTVTFITLKIGLFTGQGPDHVGELHFARLADMPAEMTLPVAHRLGLEGWSETLAPRPRSSHKGMFGHALVIGGGPGMGGAVLLAAETALRSGAGKVSAATRSVHIAPLLTRCPEVMVHSVDDPQGLEELMAGASVLVVGPGLGRSSWAQEIMDLVLRSDLPKVLDADALNIIAERFVDGRDLGENCIITPHPAEAARLLGCSTSDIQQDRLQALEKLTRRYGCAVVLKGVGSLVGGGEPGGEPVGLCTAGNPGMATAGMGDVLSGLCGALLAQKLPSGTAARYATLLHALAGDQAAEQGQRGLLATDLMMAIRRLLNIREIT
ncbi:NAD(P)H-hydrate dehydratase [Halopseudomonas salina]|uniref:Bifunctional NAD(P)H-hydrate repair enzyme n=1 Tax=Halopseudomonas salina TaxID=1323744 RepID=A0ABQ1PP86_9GAMM|nr:NAD(P)H-hydrate dehydratase [Halopseudomonas salina]GGD00475.1 bifunctional NAD(P)H-hydrate repair enzyme [Halopseudomonas salina]